MGRFPSCKLSERLATPLVRQRSQTRPQDRKQKGSLRESVWGSRRTPQHESNLRSGSEKGVFWKRGLFRKVHENLVKEILGILENRQTLENKGESDHFLEILESLEILEIPEILPAKRPLL